MADVVEGGKGTARPRAQTQSHAHRSAHSCPATTTIANEFHLLVSSVVRERCIPAIVY